MKTDKSVVNQFNFSVKAMINKDKTKVLFLEVDSDFADVLLSFLTLPLGRMVKILENHYGDTAIGSLNSLHKGLTNLNSQHFWSWRSYEILSEPMNSLELECRKLKLNVDDSKPTKYFTCNELDCKKRGELYVTTYCDDDYCDNCNEPLNNELFVRELDTGDHYGVFTRKRASFLVTDDFQILPNVPGSIIRTLSNLGITDTDGFELRPNINVGFNEIMDLLKGSLFSPTPVTDVILNKGHYEMDSATANSEQGISAHQMKKNTSSSNSKKKMTIKVMIQQSTFKLLFIQAEEDFVDFLLSFLTLPLGGVLRLLGGKTSLGVVDNLYRSIENLDNDKHMTNPAMKEGLLNPKLPSMYCLEHQIFPIKEQPPMLYYYFNYYKDYEEFASHSPRMFVSDAKDSEDEAENSEDEAENSEDEAANSEDKAEDSEDEAEEPEHGSLMSFQDPRGGSRSFVRGPAAFTVSDDLTVVPSCMTSTFSILNRMKIPITDVGEVEIGIGLEEALSILKASLTSTNALTNGLSSFLKNQPKQEQ